MSRLLVFMGCALDENGNTIGVKAVGKDTSADITEEHMKSRYNVIRLALAGGLKGMLNPEYRLDEKETDADGKEVPNDKLCGFTPRKLYELFGTEVVRNGLKMHDKWFQQIRYTIRRHELPFIQRLVAELYDLNNYELFEIAQHECIPRLKTSRIMLEKKLKTIFTKYLPLPKENKPNLYVITDCRFPNEYDSIKLEFKDLDPVFVQVRRVMPATTNHQTHKHASNCVYESMKPDIILDNNGSIQELETLIEQQLIPLFSTQNSS